MSGVYFAVVVLFSLLRRAHGELDVSIVSEPVGDPVGVYQAATPVELTCIHNGSSSSATYSWTCSGEYNCFTQGVTQPSKRRGILRGGDTGTHTCTVSDGGTTGTASTNINVTGIGFSYRRSGAKFRYVANNSAIFIPASGVDVNMYILADLECASGTSSDSLEELLFITPPQYQSLLSDGIITEPGHWKLQSSGGNYFYLSPFNGGVFTCRMPDENGIVLDTNIGIYPMDYDSNSLSVSLSYTQTELTLILNCTSTGLPPTAVTWSKDGVEISIGDTYNFSQELINVESTKYESILVIWVDSEKDALGLYHCTVHCYDDLESLIKSASSTVSITGPMVSSTMATLTVPTSSSASFSSVTSTSSSLVLPHPQSVSSTMATLNIPASSSASFSSVTNTSSSLVLPHPLSVTSTFSSAVSLMSIEASSSPPISILDPTFISISSSSKFTTSIANTATIASYSKMHNFSVTPSKASSPATSIAPSMSVIQVVTTSEAPTDSVFPEEAVSYILIGAVIIVLLFVLVCGIGCIYFCVSRKTRRREKRRRKPIDMQEFGMMPSERAMAETLSNLPKKIPLVIENIEVDHENIELTPSSVTALNKDDQIHVEDTKLDDQHDYEAIMELNLHENEAVDTNVVPNMEEESTSPAFDLSGQTSLATTGKEIVSKRQNNEDRMTFEKECEENASEDANAVIAIDEDEEAEEKKFMRADEDETEEENEKLKLQEGFSQDDMPRPEVETELHLSDIPEEMKEEVCLPSSPPLPLTQSSSSIPSSTSASLATPFTPSAPTMPSAPSTSSPPSTPPSLSTPPPQSSLPLRPALPSSSTQSPPSTPPSPSTPPPPSSLPLLPTLPSPSTQSPPSTPPSPSTPPPPSAPPPPSIPPPSNTPLLPRATKVKAVERHLRVQASNKDFEASGEITVGKFGEHVNRLHDNNNEGFFHEYTTLPMRLILPHDSGRAHYNTSKNRFRDIIPYDHSRVLLKGHPGVIGTDYINANYIHGWDRENMYIAAQGPTSKTIADFWRMIWEHKLCTIVMLTRCVEGGRTKCQQYWPNNVKMTALYDNGIHVTLDNIITFADYEYRRMTVKSESDPTAPVLEVTHFQYIIWPDHGVPQQSNSLMSFVVRVRTAHPHSSKVPLLVHCSAGVGRSGTFITLDSMMMQIKDKATLDVYGFVKGMRQQRVYMVQTSSQYIFIHDALNDMIKFGDTTIQATQLLSLVLGFNQDKTLLSDQFKMLEENSPPVNEQLCSDGLLPANEDKNRVKGIVPFNNNRIILWSPDRKEQYYINASLMNSYSHRGGFIATQTPLVGTVKQFWQMMWDFQSVVIVTLNEEEERMFVLEQGIEMEVGHATVVLESEHEEEGHVKRVYELCNHGLAQRNSVENRLKVTQFQLKTFPSITSHSSSDLLGMIDNILRIQRATGNRPITVMCPDGSGCSGVFMVVYSQLEKLKVEGLVDIFQCVLTMRMERPGIVADVQQYELCYQILSEYMESAETYSNF